MRRTRGTGPGAGVVLLVAVVLAAGAGCRPVTVTGAGPGGGTSSRAPAAGGRHLPTTAPGTPHSAAHHGRPHRPGAAPGGSGGRVRELQARLAQLGFFHRAPTGYYGPVTADAVRAFQQRQRLPRTGTAGGRTWRVLRARTHPPSRDELRPPTARQIGAPDRRCLTGRVLCISKRSRTLAWMVDGKVVSAMDVRFGSQFTPTREGTFRITVKSRRHVSTLYHTAMPYALFFSGGQAVHYSADFAARGYRGASHGCVNVRDRRRLAAVFAAVRPGTRVVVHR